MNMASRWSQFDWSTKRVIVTGDAASDTDADGDSEVGAGL